MSMIVCGDCGTMFDSDDDPECFVETLSRRRTIIVCEPCRDERAKDEESEDE